MMTVGGFLASRSLRVSPPRIETSSSLTILTTCCAGFSAPETSAPSALAHGARELLDHREGDIGIEEGEPDVTNRLVDVGLREPPLGAEVLEGRGQAIRETVEHRTG